MIRDSMPRAYAYADVGTFGLAHSLMAWARCLLWSRRHGVEMLAPTWLRIRGHIGPWLRRERDKRMYQRLFQFDSYISGLPRVLILASYPRIESEALLRVEAETLQTRRIVVFRNLLRLNEETYFPEIIHNSEEVHRALYEMTRPEYRPVLSGPRGIAVHVRLGDFADGQSVEALREGRRNSRIPLEWYCSVVSAIQGRVAGMPVVVYSDGTDVQLSKLLSLKEVSRAPRSESITDLLSMARSSLLVSSGSGFSSWASYLGQVPRICYPGQRFARTIPQSLRPDLEAECEDVSEIGDEFWSAVYDRPSAQ